MKQSEIDQLLMSSDEDNYGQKNNRQKKKPARKQQPQSEHNYEDDFFQSQNNSDLNVKQKNDKPTKQTKKNNEQKNLNGKQKPKIIKQPSQVDESNYLNSEDFQSVASSGDQKPQFQPKSKNMRKQENEENEENYEMEEDFEEQIATSRAQSQQEDLVQSNYTQSCAQSEAVEQIADNVDEDIQTVKSSNIKSKVLGDDQLSQAQSQYIESTRIDQQQFRKKQNNSNEANKNNNQPNASNTKNLDMKKKNALPLPISTKREAKNQILASKKSIPESKKLSQNKTQVQKKQINQKQQKIHPKLSNNKNKTPSQIDAQRQEHATKLQNTMAELEELRKKKVAKEKLKEDKAKEQFQLMKKQQQDRKQKNQKILEEQKLKKKQLVNPKTIRQDQRFLLQAQKNQLQLTDSRIKQLADEQQQQKIKKAQMKTALDLKEKRRKQQAQIKVKQEQQNKQKLARLNLEKQTYMDRTCNEKLQIKHKHELAIKQKQRQFNNKQNQKIHQKKQNQTPELRKLKQEILLLKQKNSQKQLSISSLDEVIKKLKKQLKQKELVGFNQGEPYKNPNSQLDEQLMEINDEWMDSDLTSVEQFIRLFDECHTPKQIFNMLDQDKDQFVSLEQIRAKVTAILLDRYNIDQSGLSQQNIKLRQNSLNQNEKLQSLVQEVFAILDKNSDGNITQQEFTFIIQSQIKKAQEYRKLTNNIAHQTPLDIEASILDMKEKIKYMSKKCIQQLSTGRLQQLQEKYHKYRKKYQEYEKRLIYGKGKHDKNKSHNEETGLQEDLNNDRVYFLTQQAQKLRLKRENQRKLLQKIRAKQQQNIKQKNIQLSKKVQQNINLNEEIYRIKLQIEQYQLRFLSKTKIQQNRHRYMEKQSQQKQAEEEAIQRVKQYQTKLLNPTKQIKFGTYASSVNYLAAVIMIQRNYRKRKAFKEKQQLQRGN